jgi:hypothetical protein
MTRRKLQHEGISKKAVDLFAHIMRRQSEGVSIHSTELLDLAADLHRTLGLKIWEEDVLDVRVGEEPRADSDPMKAASFRKVVELRRQLEEAIM